MTSQNAVSKSGATSPRAKSGAAATRATRAKGTRSSARPHRSSRSGAAKTEKVVEQKVVTSTIEDAESSEIPETPQTPTADLDEAAASADLVRVYLNEIGKVALLTAADEVELAKRIEAGLYAAHLLAAQNRFSAARKRELRLLVADGENAKDHLLRANLRLVVSLAKR